MQTALNSIISVLCCMRGSTCAGRLMHSLAFLPQRNLSIPHTNDKKLKILLIYTGQIKTQAGEYLVCIYIIIDTLEDWFGTRWGPSGAEPIFQGINDKIEMAQKNYANRDKRLRSIRRQPEPTAPPPPRPSRCENRGSIGKTAGPAERRKERVVC